jgi:hypothetical protein
MKTSSVRPNAWIVSAIVAVAGVLTAAAFVGVKAGTIILLVLAGLAYALIWEGGTRISDSVQKHLQRRRGG